MVCYNVLAKYIVDENPELYPYCGNEVEWNWRKMGLISELKELNSEIICLQEVDDHQFFAEELGQVGYESKFKKRTSQFQDGCSIFWKTLKYETNTIILSKLKLITFLDSDSS